MKKLLIALIVLLANGCNQQKEQHEYEVVFCKGYEREGLPYHFHCDGYHRYEEFDSHDRDIVRVVTEKTDGELYDIGIDGNEYKVDVHHEHLIVTFKH